MGRARGRSSIVAHPGSQKRGVSMSRTVLFCTVVLASFAIGGCTVDQVDRVDQVAADVNAVGQAITEVSQGPAATLLPPEVIRIMQLLGIGAAAAVAIWQKLKASGLLTRNRQLVATLGAVADGIDQSPPATAKAVKDQIKRRMEQRHVYDTADAIIDSVRSERRAGVNSDRPKA